MSAVKKLWTAWPFWLKLTMAAAIVFLLSAAGAWWTHDRGSFPNWLAGIATAAALLAAIVAARHAAGAFQLERAREQRWEQQQIRSHAALIAAWPGHTRHATEKVDGLDVESSAVTGAIVHIRNASDLPITRLWIEASVVVEDKLGREIDREWLGGHEIRLLAPTPEVVAVMVEADNPVDLAGYGHTAANPVPYWVDIDLHFRDAGGRDWIRTADGELLLLGDQDARD